MTEYEKPEKRNHGVYTGFDHVRFYVSNAKQVSDWYCLRFGFSRIAYKGLETQERNIASHVVGLNKIRLVFSSPLNPVKNVLMDEISVHGDFVKDVAFQVEDCKEIYNKAVKNGGKSISKPKVYKDDDGSVIMASVKTYGDCIHTFVERKDYKGAFLPGYTKVEEKDPLGELLPNSELDFIDHCVGNMPDLQMVPVCDWYSKTLNFNRFWSVDDKQVHTKYSALRSIVMSDFDRVIKMPINEPAKGLKKSQIQEYVDYHGSAGVQHIALNTRNILKSLKILKSRGLKFLEIPKSYYVDLKKRLAESKVEVKEDIDSLAKHNILVDFDDNGYLLQIFTKNVEDRPTLFFEIIQRENHSGFGAGNFKALFESIELDQDARGNLEAEDK